MEVKTVSSLTELNPILAGLGLRGMGTPTGVIKPLIAHCFSYLGEPGCGKSLFVRTMPNTIVLDIEGKHDNDQLANLPAAYLLANSYELLDACVKRLEEAAKHDKPGTTKNPFRHVAIDTIDMVQDLCTKQLEHEKGKPMNEYRGGQGGFSLVNGRVVQFLARLRAAGYTWTTVGHLKREKVNIDGADREVIRPVLTAACAGAIYNRMADFRIWMRRSADARPIKVNGKTDVEVYEKRVLVTAPDSGAASKDHWQPACPYLLPQTIDITGKMGFRTLEEAYLASPSHKECPVK